MNTAARLMVFAKAPIAGRVKTRLFPLLGPEGAARLQAQLLERTLQMACEADLATVELWLAGEPSHPWVQQQLKRFGIGLIEQQGKDLGERMARAFATQTKTPCKAVIIGTDCPSMDASVLQQALAALDQADVVFQPAEDGGYTLVGMSRHWPQLFEGIDWGGPEVLAQSLARAESLGLVVRLLPTSWDLDRPEDYQRAMLEGRLSPVEREGEG